MLTSQGTLFFVAEDILFYWLMLFLNSSTHYLDI